MNTVGIYLEYHGGCSVPWGDIMMHVGGYHEYRGGVQYRGGYHDACGGISSVLWGVQYHGGIS